MRGNDLAESYAAVIGGDALVPVGTKPLGLKPPNDTFRQVAILEATARKGNIGDVYPAGDSEHRFGQAVVEFSGDVSSGTPLFQVSQDGVQDRRPIEQERRRPGGGC